MLRSLAEFAFILSISFGSFLSYATPLHDAAQLGDVAQAGAIIMDDPSSVNVRDIHGFTPLSIAAQEGHLEVVNLLLEKGAAIETKTNYRRAPVSTAAFYSDPTIVKVLAVKGTVEAIGATPLYIAAGEGHLAVVKLLLEKGAAIEAKAEAGSTPLSTAAFNGHADVVKLLLERGAAVEGKHEDSVTPLAMAAQQGHLEVVRLLLQKGAVVDAKDNNGKTALQVAEEQGNTEVAELLREAGAKKNRLSRRQECRKGLRHVQ